MRRVPLSGLALALAAVQGAASPPPEPPPTADAAAECACLPRPALPVALAASQEDHGWVLELLTPPCPPVVEILARLDEQEETSLGFEDGLDPVTGLPAPSRRLDLLDRQLGTDDHVVTVRLVRPDGTVDGPFPLRFSPSEEALTAAKDVLLRRPYTFISFSEHGSAWTWLNFHTFFSISDSLREVRYSIDGCALDRRLRFDVEPEPERQAGGDDRPLDLTPERPFLTLPLSTRSACVQAIFRDGTVSKVLELPRTPREPED